MNDGDVVGVIKVAMLEHGVCAKQLDHVFVADLSQRDLPLFLVELEISLLQLRNQFVELAINLALIVGRARNDQRRPRFVDKNGVDFVDDRVRVSALRHRSGRMLHVIAKVVEAEFVVCAVGDVAGIRRAALLVAQPVDNAADREPKKGIDLTHPLRVAVCEVVVDGDDMHAFACEPIEIDGQRGYERLSFSGFHLGNTALMKDEPAYQLDIEVSLPKRSLCGLADRRKCFRQDVFKRLALGEPVFESRCERAQFLVGLRFEALFKGVDLLDDRGHGPELAFIGRAKESLRDRAETQHKIPR